MKIHTKIHFIFSFVVLIGLLSSCFKKEEYPIEPAISYDSYSFNGDSLNLTFNFTDGDGDIGLNDHDTITPYDTSSFFQYNLYIHYFEKDDQNGWVNGMNLSGDTVIFTYRIEPIITKGKTKGIKGKMDVNLTHLYYNTLSNQSDTIKYSIQLIDRALNKSNIVESAEIVR